MHHRKIISLVFLPISLIVILYSSFIQADNVNPSTHNNPSEIVKNPINSVQSGSIIYQLSDNSPITQLALDTKVQMQISGMINRVKLEQTFLNPSKDWVEGIYVFPLPENSAVDQLQMKIGNRLIQGEIQERTQAKKRYQQAKKQGKKATLIEQQRPNIFTTNLANIAPGESITVMIEYQQSVKIDNNQYSIRFPMLVADRYVHNQSHSSSAQLKNSIQLNAPTSQHSNRPVSIDIMLKAGFDIENVQSSYHTIQQTKLDPLTQQITLKTQADRDFELSWKPAPSSSPTLALFTEQKGDDHYLMLMTTPPTNQTHTQNRAREVVFVIDSSGSMMGASMIQATKALNRAIERLNPTDRFNIIDFDTDFEALYDHAIPASEMNKRHGLRFSKYLQAEGGTEPLEALEFALKSRNKDSDQYLRQIIFLTDGQVGNEVELFQALHRHIDDDRLFTISIGSAPNDYLLRKMANLGRGTLTHIGKIDEVETKMNQLFDKLESPAFTDIQLDFPMGINAESAHDKINDLYKGEVVLAAYKLNAMPNQISVRGKTQSGIVAKTIAITPSNQALGISTHWARMRIDQLMDLYNLQDRRIERDQLQTTITQLALEHHLVSKFTSLIAVEKTPTNPNAKSLVSKRVSKKVKAANTATDSYFWMIIGLVFILIAVFLPKHKTQ